MDDGTQQYDAIVIGAGQAGGPLATALAGSGRRTAIVEREHVGGTCVNEGCTPTKTMAASARVAYVVRRAADYGVHVAGEVTVDQAKVRARKQAMVDRFRTGSEGSLTGVENLDLLDGEARFVGPKTFAVTMTGGGERRIAADLVFLNVGDRPTVPPIDGIKTVPVLDSTTVQELGEVPRHLIVIGGSYIGAEFAQMFRRFGAAVTMVVRGPQLLGREDPDVAEALTDILREDGIEVLLGCEPKRVAPGPGGGVRVTVGPKGEGQTRELDGSHLLAATGRVPNTDLLDPTAGGVETDDKGNIPTDATLATNVPGVYALGDVRGGPAFTHVSYDDFRVIRTNLLEGGHRTIDDRILPYTVFTDPQLGRVGMSERDARDAGKRFKVARMPMERVARALELDEPRGLMKAVVDADTDRILGAAVLGIEGGEVASMFQIAMMGDLPYTALRDAMLSHPTLSESLNNLFASFET